MTEAVEAGSTTDATAAGEAESGEIAGAGDGDSDAAVTDDTTTTTTADETNAFAAPDAAQDEPAATPEADADADAANPGGGGATATCEDKSPHCVAWKKDGQCDSNPRFMALRCANACDLCEGSDGHTKLHAPAAAGSETLVERPSKSTLWGMLTGKTAKHLEGGKKLRVKLEQHAPMEKLDNNAARNKAKTCLLYTSPSPRDATLSRMPSSA